MRQLSHAEVVDDEERHDGEIGEIGLACAVECGVSECLQQRVRLAIQDAIALLDHGAADGQLVDQGPVHLLVEIEIESVQRACRITEARLFVPALEETILPTQQLIGHEHRDQIDRSDLA